MKNSKGLIDSIKSNIIHYFFILAAICLAALGVGGKVAEGVEVRGFYDLIDTSGGAQYTRMENGPTLEDWGNLMVRDSNGVASVVEKDGSVWRMGFVKYVEGGMTIGGYANNDNSSSNEGWEGCGWCDGTFYNSVFDSNEAVHDVLVVHDANGDGMGEVIGSVWYLGGDDTTYWTEDIEFNGIQGDLSQMPPTLTGGTLILPQMTITPVYPPCPCKRCGRCGHEC